MDTLFFDMNAAVAFVNSPHVMAFIPAFVVGMYLMSVPIFRWTWARDGFALKGLAFAFLWAVFVPHEQVTLYHLFKTFGNMISVIALGVAVFAIGYMVSTIIWLPIVNRRDRVHATQA